MTSFPFALRGSVPTMGALSHRGGDLATVTQTKSRRITPDIETDESVDSAAHGAQRGIPSVGAQLGDEAARTPRLSARRTADFRDPYLPATEVGAAKLLIRADLGPGACPRTRVHEAHGGSSASTAPDARTWRNPCASRLVWYWAAALDERGREPRHGAMRNRARPGAARLPIVVGAVDPGDARSRQIGQPATVRGSDRAVTRARRRGHGTSR